MLLFTSVWLLSVTLRVSAVATETVVGVAGQVVKLPCRLDEAKQSGVEVCWGRGKPSLFTCHNTLINGAGGQVTYRQSHRFSVSFSTSALSISGSRLSDAGFYHCRVHLPGPFNDPTSTVHLIIIQPRSVIAEHLGREDVEKFNTPDTITSFITNQRGSDVTVGAGTEPMVAQVQSPDQEESVNSLQTFIGSTLRLAFILFIPAVLLAAGYRVWRSNQEVETEGRLDQSEEEETSSV
ncbi:hepatitis A virus cellular receptor 2 homolog [Poecilia latipinna]|uniref:Hepatitis A virus cellular receptor 2 homolog n=1 Tax=Poecilia latipinna TaxID=48699 RepID=A0A3B3VXH5_9TELE|nr:PREDICTED: hepatitis A virus cellular receptor 2 homolog [Poecilia latipinna]XP_014870278.1 PREDICTED: hepatitis A virus cellular receptor 2 homolog [Poecilia latipinna]XP_014870279.1 PREDICTED: hepatitis A virus cellular receptor 2 homolog [Poecilia latipinna]XP_014870280.1 PREDICTED: hepatitis A virus cellular receptor 2 homolog [Poecilia latipinna]